MNVALPKTLLLIRAAIIVLLAVAAVLNLNAFGLIGQRPTVPPAPAVAVAPAVTPPVEPPSHDDRNALRNITTRSGLELALAQERSAVFLYVNWSLDAVLAEKVIRDGRQAISVHPPIEFFRVDLSSQEGEVWDAVCEWLNSEGENFASHMSSGYGATILVRRGHVVGIFEPRNNLGEAFVAKLSEALESLGSSVTPVSSD